MAAYEEFIDMVDEILLDLPEEFFRDLNGGVNVKEECRIHPEAIDDSLIILGEYHCDRYLGKFINIYYGSFERVYGFLKKEELKKQIRKTVLHEFRHHLETLAGEKGLAVEDAMRLSDYRKTQAHWNF